MVTFTEGPSLSLSLTLAALSFVQGLAAKRLPPVGADGRADGGAAGSAAAREDVQMCGSSGGASGSSGSGSGAAGPPAPVWDFRMAELQPLRLAAGALDACVGLQQLDGELAEAFALTACALAAAAPRELRRDVAGAAGARSRVFTPRLLTALLPHLPDGPRRAPLTAALQVAAAMLARWQDDRTDAAADAAAVQLLEEAARMTHAPLLLPRGEANALWRGCDNQDCNNFAGDSEAALELSRCDRCGVTRYCRQ